MAKPVFSPETKPMTFGEKVVDYYRHLRPPGIALPDRIEWIESTGNAVVQATISEFFTKYFSDQSPRIFLIGINPGRFGAGVTGVPFTDPVNLEKHCGIKNGFEKKHELSSRFVYEVVEAFGGAAEFYRHCYITSVCPLGFIKNGKNINYYDNKELQSRLWDFMKAELTKQIEFGANRKVAFSIGKGKNIKALKKMNEEEGWFDKVETLPHPRWVMQYRLKRKAGFVDEYLQKISAV